MLPTDYRWAPLWEGHALYLDGVGPYSCRCAHWGPLPGDGGVLLHFGVRDCLPRQRRLATPEGARRFAEAWAIKWDTEIRVVMANKGVGERWVPPSLEVSQLAASRDAARRRGRRTDWWKQK